MARFIEGGIWIGTVNIDIQTSMFVLEKKIFQYCNFFLHFIQNRPLPDFHTLGKLLHFQPTSFFLFQRKVCLIIWSTTNHSGSLSSCVESRQSCNILKPVKCETLVRANVLLSHPFIPGWWMYLACVLYVYSITHNK